MLLEYELRKNFKDFKVVYAKNTEILNYYYQNLVYNLVSFFTGLKNFGLIIKKLGDKIEVDVILKNKNKFKININKDTAEIFIYQKKYTFRHAYLENGIRLKLISIFYYLEDQEIMESFRTHHLNFKIKINGYNKYFEVDIPYNINKVVEPIMFYGLKPTSTLNDLRKIYNNYFKDKQSAYDFLEQETILSVNELSKNTTSIDKIHLQGGKPIFYDFNVKKDNIIFRVSYSKESQEPLISILGANSGSNINFDLEIRTLLKKVEEYIWHEEIKLIKLK